MGGLRQHGRGPGVAQFRGHGVRIAADTAGTAQTDLGIGAGYLDSASSDLSTAADATAYDSGVSSYAADTTSYDAGASSYDSGAADTSTESDS
jgi:hypothetical protein